MTSLVLGGGGTSWGTSSCVVVSSSNASLGRVSAARSLVWGGSVDRMFYPGPLALMVIGTVRTLELLFRTPLPRPPLFHLLWGPCLRSVDHSRAFGLRWPWKGPAHTRWYSHLRCTDGPTRGPVSRLGRYRLRSRRRPSSVWGWQAVCARGVMSLDLGDRQQQQQHHHHHHHQQQQQQQQQQHHHHHQQ